MKIQVSKAYKAAENVLKTAGEANKSAEKAADSAKHAAVYAKETNIKLNSVISTPAGKDRAD